MKPSSDKNGSVADIMPILLGDDLRPFEISSDKLIRLAKIQVVELPAQTHIRFRVLK